MTTTTSHSVTLLTADDLAQLPDDGFLYELDRGDLVRLPLSNFNSSHIAMKIGVALGSFAHAAGLGLVAGADGAFVLSIDPDTVRVPDVSFVRADRLPPVQDRNRFLRLAPDLAVEVVSPSDTTAETLDKVREYLDAGVRMIWVVQPGSRMVTVYAGDRTARVLYEEETIDGVEVLPGFTLLVAEMFP